MNLKSDAKLRRESADSKKNRNFFSCLYGQTPGFWTNRGNCFRNCPKEPKKGVRILGGLKIKR